MQVSPPQFAYLRGLLKKKTGVIIDDSKHYLVVARLLPIVKQRKLPSLDTLIDRYYPKRQGADGGAARSDPIGEAEAQ